MPDLNPVCHGALENRGAGIVALHLHYERRHDKSSLGRFYRNLGTFMESPNGILMTTEVQKEGRVICLVPVDPIDVEQPLKAASIHMGWTPPDGILPFIQEGSCQPIEEPSHERH